MKKLIIILSLLVGMKIFADDGSVEGSIQDGSGEPLWGANVYLLSTSFGASTDSAGTYQIKDIPVGKYTLVCDYIGYRSQSRTIYISAYDADSDTDTDQSYLDKMGLEEDEDIGLAIIKGNDLRGINFDLEEDVFNSQEVVVTGVASERSVEVSEVAVTRLKPRKFNESTSYTDFGSLLMAKVSGLDIRKASGTVGGGFRLSLIHI